MRRTAAEKTGKKARPARSKAFRPPPGFLSTSQAEALGLLFVLLLAACLRLWNLPQNGFGNLYYAAAVRSMLQSWHNFFFVSFDPSGYVTVDKPPLALWLQAASARLLGYGSFSLLLPQALEGIFSVFLVFKLLRPRFGALAGLLAALAMALSPVCVATDRFNNVDSCLVMVLLLAAWALEAALRRRRAALWFLSLGLVGLGFNTKMAAAFLVLPAFYLYYLLSARETWLRRLAYACLGTLALAGVALSWPLAVDFTPAEERPYVGSTRDNSMLSLSLGWNGFQRLIRGRRFGRAAEAAPRSLTEQAQAFSPLARIPGRMGRRRAGGFMGAGQPGPLRLAEAQMAGQVAWLLPLALLGFLAGFTRKKPVPPRGSPRLELIFWGLWLLASSLVFSFMRGIIHPYYLVLLAPPLAALAGSGIVALWKDFCSPGWRRVLLPLALWLTLAWQAFILSRYPGWLAIGLPLSLAAGLLACLIFFTLPRLADRAALRRRWTGIGLATGLLSLLACPLFWSLTPLMASAASPEAGPGPLSAGPRDRGQNPAGSDASTRRLLAFLQARRQGQRYLVAALNSQLVAPIIIKTGEPALALGGFMGADPILTPAELAQMVRRGQLSYVLIPAVDPQGPIPGGAAARPGPGQNNSRNALAQWVRLHGKRVDPKLWKPLGLKEEIPAWFEEAATGNPRNFQGGVFGRGALASLDLYEISPQDAGAFTLPVKRRFHVLRGHNSVPMLKE